MIIKKSLSLFLFLSSVTFVTAQHGQASPNPDPYIEVVGTASTKVVPNEIYITICMEDQLKDKRSLADQEKDLKESLVKLGIPLKKLTLSDANSDYVRIRWKGKGVVNKAEYTLKLSDAKEVAVVFKELDEIKVIGAFISKVAHSEIVGIKKKNRIEAIKKAKEKADYLLAAIGEKTGKPLVVNETSQNHQSNYENVKYDNYVANSSSEKVGRSSNYYRNAGVQFEKIVVKTSIYVKFKID